METTRLKPKFLSGTTFMSRGRHPRLCTVVDVHMTHNLAGEHIRTRYVAIHEFMGQVITNTDVTETAVAMGLVAAVCERVPVEEGC